MKFKPLIRYFLFFFVMAYTFQWTAINLYLSSLGQKGQLLRNITDSPLIKTIYHNTDLKISSFHIVNSPHPYGLMIGLPNKPYMVLSSYLYQNFNNSELEYVITHEAGHYVLQHSIIEFIFFIFLFIVGCLVVKKRSIFFTPPAGLIFSILMIQLGRLHEIQADQFTARHMSDPQGMISATYKFQNFYGQHYTAANLIGHIFYRSNPYSNRIKIAQQEIKNRKN